MHTLTRHRLAWLTAAALALALGGCGGSDNDASPPPASDHELQITTPGTPTGEATSAALNGAGGSLESSDGRLRVTVPEGALSKLTTLSVQPITNGLPSGFGPAYRLLPEGLTFDTPVTLSFSYTDDDLLGSAPGAVMIATQKADGSWQAYTSPDVDAANRRVSVSTTHFSDWAPLVGYRLQPHSATVMVNKTVELKTFYYPANEAVAGAKSGLDEIIPLPLGNAEPIPPSRLSEWSVNGIPGGNSTVGTISSSGVYTAPAKKPASNPVAVSVKTVRAAGEPGERNLILVANIKVVDDVVTYAGNITGTLHRAYDEVIEDVTISANNIRLTRDELLPGDLSHYVLSSGTVTLASTITTPDGTITGSSSNSTPVGAILQIFDPVRPQGPGFAGKYWINATGRGTDDTGTLATISVLGVGTSCPNTGTDPAVHPTYGDNPSVLEGSFSATCTVGDMSYDMMMQWSLHLVDEDE